MRTETKQRKPALAGVRAISGEQQLLGTLVRVIGSGKQALAKCFSVGWGPCCCTASSSLSA